MMTPRTIVFDIETQREFAEVGGAQNRHLLGVAIIGYYDSLEDRYIALEERDVLAFGKVLKSADLVVGFNSEHFDLPVLQPYLPFDVAKLPSLDLMRELERVLGHRVSLDACAEATLGKKKSGDGLQALRWFREGKVEQVKAYCLDDVRLTRELYEYGCANGEVFFTGKQGERRVVPVTWGSGHQGAQGFREALAGAFRAGKRVEIEYVSAVASGEAHRNRRKIDIMRFDGEAVHAFCHLRQDERRFAIDRITDVVVLAEPANAAYQPGQASLL